MNTSHCNYHACRMQLASRYDLVYSGRNRHDSTLNLSNNLARAYASGGNQHDWFNASSTSMEPIKLSSTAKLSQIKDEERLLRHACMDRRHGERTKSAYCIDHTCEFFFSHEKCGAEKSPQNPFCNLHTICPIDGCGNGKYHDMDSNRQKFRSHEFCSTHRCASPDCELLCDELYNNDSSRLYGRFCYKHRCFYNGCDKPGLPGQRCCTKHRCKHTSTVCERIVVEGHELCLKHVECAERSCNERRHYLPVHGQVSHKDHRDCNLIMFGNKLYLDYCENHGSCSASGCTGLRVRQALHCRKHFCLERNCAESRGSNAKFCNNHRCQWMQCEAAKDWKEDSTRFEFCNRHRCRHPDCRSGVGDDQLYCADHKCSNEGCVNKLAGGGLCYDHAVLKSQSKTRTQSKTEAQGWISWLHPSGAGLGPSVWPHSAMASNLGRRSSGEAPHRRATTAKRQTTLLIDDDYDGSSYADIKNDGNDNSANDSDSDSDSDNAGKSKGKNNAWKTLAKNQGNHGDVAADMRPRGMAMNNGNSKQPMATAGVPPPSSPQPASPLSNQARILNGGQPVYPQTHPKGSNQRQ